MNQRGPGSESEFAFTQAVEIGEVEDSYNPIGVIWYVAAAILGILTVGIVSVAGDKGESSNLVALAAAVSLLTHLVVVAAREDLRLDGNQLLRPLGWLNAAWYVQVVIVPVAIVVFGTRDISLYVVPHQKYIAIAIIINALAFISWALGVLVAGNRRRKAIERPRHRLGPSQFRWLISTPAIIAAIVVGGAALLFVFGSPANLLRYFLGNVEAAARKDSAAGLFIPLLGLAGAAVFCNWILSGRRTSWAIFLAAILVVLGFGTNNYGRGPLVVIALILGSIYSRYRKQVRFLPLAVIGLFGGWILLTVGAYRTIFLRTEGGLQTASQVGLDETQLTDVFAQISLYLRAPQYIAAAVRSWSEGWVELGPENLLASVLITVPSLGRQYDELATRVPFSYVVRGAPGVTDISPPLTVDLYWTTGIVGLAVGFGLFGMVLKLADRYYGRCESPLRLFLTMYIVFWMGSMLSSSISVFAQALIQIAPSLVVFLAMHYLLPVRNPAQISGSVETTRI